MYNDRHHENDDGYVFIRYDIISEQDVVVGSYLGTVSGLVEHMAAHVDTSCGVYKWSFNHEPKLARKKKLMDSLLSPDNPCRDYFIEYLKLIGEKVDGA